MMTSIGSLVTLVPLTLFFLYKVISSSTKKFSFREGYEELHAGSSRGGLVYFRVHDRPLSLPSVVLFLLYLGISPPVASFPTVHLFFCLLFPSSFLLSISTFQDGVLRVCG